MKNFFIFLGGMAVVICLLLFLRFTMGGPEDNWICENNQWAKHGNPENEAPLSGCGEKIIEISDPYNTIYNIEGREIKVKSGYSEDQIAEGESSKIITKIFEVQDLGDLNKDNYPDEAVLLTQEQGGSGTFYYISIAFKIENGYQGANAVLLGDRIVPKNIEIKDDLITVNYLDRKIDEDFSIEPSVSKTKYFVYQNNTLFETPEAMRIESPLPNESISSPLNIVGKARGTWFFEASFPVSLVNWDGLIIAEGVARAEGDWMTEDFIPFKATLEFEKPEYKNNGALILKKDNPSGLPENDDALEIPILFE